MIRRLKEFLFENRTTRQTVAKNTIWLTFSNFGGRVLKAVVVIYGARVLGTEGWGLFSYATTLAGFLTLFMDPGINFVLMRDASTADNEDARTRILSATFFIKLCLIILGVLVVIFIGPTFSTLPGAKALLPIVAAIIAFDTMREFFASFIRTREKMEREAGIFLLSNAAIVTFGFLFLQYIKTPAALGWGYALGTAVGLLASIIVLRQYLKKIFFLPTFGLFVNILRTAWPFAITGALGVLLTNADVLIISWMRTASEVGIYSAAIRIIQFFYIIPAIIQLSSMPLLSRLARTDNEKFRAAFERIVSLTFIPSIPLALGGIILAKPILELAFGGAYGAGAISFGILMATMLVDYPGTIVGSAVFTYDRQKNLIVFSALAGGLNVLLDLLLIPRFGIAGSATATLLAQIIGQGYLWYTMKKINPFRIAPHIKKIVAAGVLMAIGTAILAATGTNLIVTIVISALFYFILLKVFREPLLGEIKNIVLSRPAQETAA